MILAFPTPPLPEQAAIVRYLDHVDRRIRRYVSAKRTLIALLEEEKQAIINRAVTQRPRPRRPPQALRRRVARPRAGALESPAAQVLLSSMKQMETVSTAEAH